MTVMNRYLLAACATLALTPIIYAQGDVVSDTIRLSHLYVESAPALSHGIQGIGQLTLDYQNNSVTVTGTQQAVDAFEAKVHDADVELTQYQIKTRLVRYHVDKKGKVVEVDVTSPTVIDTENTSSAISFSQNGSTYAVVLTPKKESDNAITLTAEVRELGEQGELISSGKNTQQIQLGETARVTGMTEAKDKTLRRAVEKGQIVTDQGEYTGYYLEVTPTIPAAK